MTRKISEMNDIPFGDDSNIVYVNAEKASAIAVERDRKLTARTMLENNKFAIEEVAAYSRLPPEEVRKLAAEAESKPE